VLGGANSTRHSASEPGVSGPPPERREKLDSPASDAPSGCHGPAPKITTPMVSLCTTSVTPSPFTSPTAPRQPMLKLPSRVKASWLLNMPLPSFRKYDT
jgi:hypothetical protein